MVGAFIGAAAIMPDLAIFAGLVLLAVVSWLDDRNSLPIAVRFVSQVVAGGLALSTGLASQWWDWGWLAQMAVLLLIVWMINLYNFMDGANGLAGGMAVFGFGAYALVAWVAGESALGIWASCIVGAAGGFLLFNFDPARIFMGDVGSVPLGFLAAILGLEGIRLNLWPIWFPILVFSPFIADASATLVKRALRGDKVWVAHREHFYQKLVRSGWTHRKLAVHEYVLMAATSTSACIMLNLTPAIQGAALLVWVVVLGGLMAMVESLKRSD